jgi:hypothetical protein
MMYRNKDTGVSYTMSELEAIWREHGEESKHETFEDMLNDLEKLDVVYLLTDMDSKHDDDFGDTFETKEEAIKAFWRAYADHRRQGTQDDIIRLDVYEYGREKGEELIDVDFDDANQGENIIDVWDARADEWDETFVDRQEIEELEIKALSDGTREDVNRLGKWFETYGEGMGWNGECWTSKDKDGREYSIYPIQVPDREDEDNWRLCGFTFDADKRFPRGRRR